MIKFECDKGLKDQGLVYSPTQGLLYSSRMSSSSEDGAEAGGNSSLVPILRIHFKVNGDILIAFVLERQFIKVYCWR